MKSRGEDGGRKSTGRPEFASFVWSFLFYFLEFKSRLILILGERVVKKYVYLSLYVCRMGEFLDLFFRFLGSLSCLSLSLPKSPLFCIFFFDYEPHSLLPFSIHFTLK